ncbi:MAG: M1 family metallopeptidase [Vicinamibacteria bacterium]
MKRTSRRILAGALLALVAPVPAQRAATPLRLPPLESAYPLPPLPSQSPRNASYAIEALLDVDRHTIEGTLELEWRNTTGAPQRTFPFHLYWNAFRDNLSTSARGASGRAARFESGDRGFGYTQVRRISLVDGQGEADLTGTLRYVQPDDGNTDDRTLAEVESPRPVPPDATVRFRVAWTSRVPYGDVGRAGWVHDYHFFVQWFPKIAGTAGGRFVAHQFHPHSEFFSDFGVYDVRLTLPRGFVVGATGRQESRTDNPDGSETFRFVQEDVHVFAWTASRRYLDRRGRFEDAGYPPVELRLLLQPEHAHLADRYLEAARIALRSYGAWSAPYPYAQMTVVDPAWTSGAGGMEYPTLLTGGANRFSPPVLQSPEGVTIHESGHQFWYLLVANNEFEEAWLDEGFNRYHDRKAAFLALGPKGWGRRYFGLPGRGGSGWPVVAPGVFLRLHDDQLPQLRRSGRSDTMSRPTWRYLDQDSWGLNSYGKPALSLHTLEGLLGEETMTRVLRTYAHRYRFQHPTSRDFVAVVNEVTGADWQWYFDEIWNGSGLVDYAVSVTSEDVRRPKGFVEGDGGALALAPSPPPSSSGEKGPYESEVTVRRLGDARLPVEVLVEFEDGRSRRESWDGRDPWVRFRYRDASKVSRAVVDPDGKIALDVDPANNSWTGDDGVARRAARKWSARFLLWLQNLLELHTVLA